jgi:hypothetical protein
MGGTPTVQKMIIQLPKCGKIIHVTKYNIHQHQTIYYAAKTQDQFWGFQTTSQFQLQPLPGECQKTVEKICISTN